MRWQGELFAEELNLFEEINRARYCYQQDPTAQKLQVLQELEAQLPPERKQFQLPEQYAEEVFFRKEYAVSLVKHPRYHPSSAHAHDFYELIYVFRGTCRNYLNNVVLDMQPGDLCMLPPNQMHDIHCFRDDGVILNILIRKSTFQNSFSSLLSEFGLLSSFFSHTLFQKKNNAYLLFRCGEDEKISSMIQQMYEEYWHWDDLTPNILSGQLILLLALLLRRHQCDAVQFYGKDPKRNTVITDMLNYIHDHICTVTLEDVADVFGYSSGRCSNIIKGATGKTFSQIIQEEKVSKAAKLLLAGEKSMFQIAEACGFYDSSHLYRVFSKVYGISPAQYRKEHEKTI